MDGDRWRIISDGGSVTKKVFLNGRLHATVLPPNGDWQPMEVLLERPDFTSLPPSPFNGEGIVGSGLVPRPEGVEGGGAKVYRKCLSLPKAA